MKHSFVIPLYNEEESLPELYSKLTKFASALDGDYELIFIDDGSRDSSFALLSDFYNKDSHVKVFQFRNNLGKSAALQEGFQASQGEMVITLDADLQDDPSEISKLFKKLDEGYDLVSSWKKDRKDPLSKTFPSKFFNLVVRILSGVHLHDFNSGLKVYRREVVKGLSLYGELHRFIPVLAHGDGFKVSEVPIIHYPRRYGVSKFGWSRMPKGFFDFITVLFLRNYGMRPLHFFGSIGLVSFLLGFILGLYLTYLRLLGERIGDRPLLFLTVLLIVTGLQFIFTGLLAEMILHLTPRQKLPVKQVLTRNE